jgi:CheY-like chemotaxis protein
MKNPVDSVASLYTHPENAIAANKLRRRYMFDAKVTLLIVDNDPSVRFSLCQIFRCMGHSVRAAEDGFHALKEMGAAIPDILIADLSMPRMSGFELLSVVRRRFPSVFVIGMTGAVSDGLPSGIAADAFYKKTAGPVALLQLVKTGSEADRVSIWASRKTAPIWVSSGMAHDSDCAQIFLGCPECLRAFPHASNLEGLVQETTCAHCSAPINYAVVEQLA